MKERSRMETWDRRRLLATSAASLGLSFVPPVLRAQAASGSTHRALTPELEEGPFYVSSELVRSDIRENQAGLPLTFQVSVIESATGKPIPQAAVDIWHCDAMGLYSGFTKASMGPPGGRPGGGPPGTPANEQGGPHPFGPPPGSGGPGTLEDRGGPGDHHRDGPPRMKQTDQLTFLRGVQQTGADGLVTFQTIYPGWYQGRDTHIHLRVHLAGHTEGKHYAGGHICHTGQVAFPDAMSDRVAELHPYSTHKERRTRLEEDGVFHGEAPEVMVELAELKPGSLEGGMRGAVIVAVDPKATPKPAGRAPGEGLHRGAPPGPDNS